MAKRKESPLEMIERGILSEDILLVRRGYEAFSGKELGAPSKTTAGPTKPTKPPKPTAPPAKPRKQKGDELPAPDKLVAESRRLSSQFAGHERRDPYRTVRVVCGCGVEDEVSGDEAKRNGGVWLCNKCEMTPGAMLRLGKRG